MPKGKEEKTKSVLKIAKYLKHKKLTILLVITILLIAFAAISIFFAVKERSDNATKIHLGNKVFSYEVADNDFLRAKGLGGRSYIPEDQAMLFVFDNTDTHCFWMKDMKFSIDILWLNESKDVIHVEKNVSPSSYPKSYCPMVNAWYVVEVRSGIADKLGLSTGSKVNF